LPPDPLSEAKRANSWYDAEDVYELLNARDQELTPDHLVEIWKQSGLEGAE
jgi:hypothetical protein